jgi:predicted permease
MGTWVQDLKFGARTLVKRPAFTTVAVLSLALGIGANTAIFTVINAVFLHPLPIEDPARVAELFTRDTKTVQAAGFNLTPTSLQNFKDYRDQNTAFSALAGYFFNGLQWTHEAESEGMPGMMTTANYFDLLGIKPFLGRLFRPDEDLDNPAMVAVLSHSVWTSRFGADRAVVNTTITLNGLPFTVIGVTPAGFNGTASLAGPDRIWVPLGMREQLLTGQIKTLMGNRRFRWLNILGRLKPGVSLAQAQSGLKAIAVALEQQFPDANQGRTIEVTSVSDAALGVNNRRQFVQAGGVLMTVVALVLLIACANLANLLLAQAARREREITVRAALGASRARLMRQLLVESALLSIAGGGAGLLVAFWGRHALWSFRPPFLGNAAIDLSFDPLVLAFTAGVSLLTGVVFGLMPAIRLSRTKLGDALKSGGRSGSLGLGHSRLRSVLVASEIALATVALIGSGLFVRSMQAAETMDVGFDAQHLGFVRVDPGGQHYPEALGQQFYLDAIAKARQVAGVESAAVASVVPIAGGNGLLLTVFPEGQAQNSTYRGSLVAFNDVTPGYFSTLRIPFREGRDFTEFDRAGTTMVTVVNEVVAKQLWPGQSALHKRFTVVQSPALYEVVGVVANSVINRVGEDPAPMIARPMLQDYAPAAALVVRTSNDPGALLSVVRDQIQTLDKNMPLRGTGTIQQQIEQGLWAPRMGAVLLSVFGGLAFTLAMIGIYGVMSHSVAQRTPEIGIRMAFGAQPRDVMRLILGQGMRLALVGTAAGVVAALLLGRLVADLLFGIRPQDPVTIVVVTVALSAVAMVACYIPARRATRVDPLVALRDE